MPFETFAQLPRRIAIVGGGVSGMAAAHQLADENAVTLFEAESRLGGHARTVIAGKNADQPVDTGFIVFNKVNYPHLVALFDHLNVPVVKSDMSFGASIGGGKLEYALKSIDSLFAQRRNLASPRFLQMCRDILHFNKHAESRATPAGLTIGGLLDDLGTGTYFRDYYILPLSGAIWSTPTQGVLDFPAQALIRFFKNHALMTLSGQHQWFTVQGGSIQYVQRLQSDLIKRGVDIRLGAPIAGIERAENGVKVRATGGDWELFDELVMATHSDDALSLLSDPTDAERATLAAVRYQPNEAVLHADESLMPRARKCWSSWVYTEPHGPRPERIDLTYWMNSLQPIPQSDPMFVTLNSNRPINEKLIYDTVTFRHPIYDLAALAAQDKIRAMNGRNNTWFCGAWMKSGFHEDGFTSAVDVVQAMRQRHSLRQVA